jgi:hypothetical protein
MTGFSLLQYRVKDKKRRTTNSSTKEELAEQRDSNTREGLAPFPIENLRCTRGRINNMQKPNKREHHSFSTEGNPKKTTGDFPIVISLQWFRYEL